MCHEAVVNRIYKILCIMYTTQVKFRPKSNKSEGKIEVFI